jgi:hypothetical protein
MSSATPIIDHEHVRKWIESHKGRPARIVGTGKGEDPGQLAIKFQHSATESVEELPGISGCAGLREIAWHW